MLAMTTRKRHQPPSQSYGNDLKRIDDQIYDSLEARIYDTAVQYKSNYISIFRAVQIVGVQSVQIKICYLPTGIFLTIERL